MIAIEPNIDATAALLAAANSGQVLYLRNGVYPITETIVLGSRTRIIGEGVNSRLEFHGAGVCVSLARDINANVTGETGITGVSIASTPESTGSDAIEIQGGIRQIVEDVYFEGSWRSCLALDGAENCTIRRLRMGNDDIGIWICDGTRDGGFTKTQATNLNRLEDLYFNGPPTPLRVDGGLGNRLQMLYASGSGESLVYGGVGLEIDGYWLESPTGPHVRFVNPTPEILYVAGFGVTMKRFRGGVDQSFQPFAVLDHFAVLKGPTYIEGWEGSSLVGLFDRSQGFIDDVVGGVDGLGNTNHAGPFWVGG